MKSHIAAMRDFMDGYLETLHEVPESTCMVLHGGFHATLHEVTETCYV